MSITIHAIADDRRHGESILSRLATAGFGQEVLHLAPTGMHRLVRGTAQLYRSIANRLMAGSAVVLGAVGAAIGLGVALEMVLQPQTAPVNLAQALLIVLGAPPVGFAVGALAGLLIGWVAGAVRVGVRQRQDEAHAPMMLEVEADSVDSAIAAETILTASGAHEVRIGRME